MMFVGCPIPDIQASDLNQTVFLCLFQDALCEGSRAEAREKRQDVERDHFENSEFGIQETGVAGVQSHEARPEYGLERAD